MRGRVILKKISKAAVGFFLGIFIIWLLVESSDVEFNSVSGLFEYNLLLSVALLKLISTMLIAYRWMIVLRCNNINQYFFDSLKFILIGHSLMTVVPGIVGQDLVKIAGTIHTSKTSRQHVKILLLAILDRLLGIFSLFLSSLFLILVYFSYEYITFEVQPVHRLLVMVLFICILALTTLMILYFGFSKIKRLTPIRSSKKMNIFFLKISKIIDYLDMINNKKTLVYMSMLSHIINSLILILIVKEFDSEIYVLINIIFGLISNFANFFPFTPGGLGVTESVFMYLYSHIGNDNGVIIGVSYRILSYVSVFTLTLIVLITSYFKLGRSKN